MPLPLGLVDGDGRAMASAPGSVPAVRGPGRPPGARNKKTEAFREHILSRFKSPLTVLAETYSRPVADLARELGIKKGEAYKMQMDAAEKLAPYLHSKAPIEVTGKDGRAVSLFIGIVPSPNGAGPPGDGAQAIIQGRIIPPDLIEQNQDDSE